jgi:hypothetical protein
MIGYVNLVINHVRNVSVDLHKIAQNVLFIDIFKITLLLIEITLEDAIVNKDIMSMIYN